METVVNSLSFAGTLLTLGGTTYDGGQSTVPKMVRCFATLFLVVDVADVIFDFIFAVKLSRLGPEVVGQNEHGKDVTLGHRWAGLVSLGTTFAVMVVVLGKYWLRKETERDNDNENEESCSWVDCTRRPRLNLFRRVCIVEFLCYVLEDTTSVAAYVSVEGAFEDSLSDRINIILSIVSGALMAGGIVCSLVHHCGAFGDVFVDAGREEKGSLLWRFVVFFIWALYFFIVCFPIYLVIFFSYVAIHYVYGQNAVDLSLLEATIALNITSIVVGFVALSTIQCRISDDGCC